MTPAEEAKNLKETAAMLNDSSGTVEDWQGKNYGREDAIRLRRLVLAWKEAGRDWRDMKVSAEDRARVDNFIADIRVRLEWDGALSLIDYYTRSHPFDAAAMNFSRLIHNSQRARLGGPCLQCGTWYASKTKRETLYCSRKCAGNAAKAQQRKRDHDRLLGKVRKALGNYETRPARFAEMSWKDFVIKAVNRVSKKFLTTAVSKGEILPPKENGL
jgi:hypothetical protein